MVQNGGAFVLVLSSEQTEKNLAVLRKNAVPRKKKRNTALDDIMMKTDEFGLPVKAEDPNDRIAEKIVSHRGKSRTPSTK
jgi:hypothetical protein